jgi:hypothetical protein
MTNDDETIGEKALVVVAKNPANISFLVRSVGISLIIFTIIFSIGTTAICSETIKKYIESKIEPCDAK